MCSVSPRKPHPSDVSDEEWSLVVSYLTLMTEVAPQREHSLRELFNALRYVIRYGIAWRAMPNDFPPWAAVYQQSQRWLASGCFETLAQGGAGAVLAADDLRRLDRRLRVDVDGEDGGAVPGEQDRDRLAVAPARS